jgi:hypothetical protein
MRRGGAKRSGGRKSLTTTDLITSFSRRCGVELYVLDFSCPHLKLAIEVDEDSQYIPRAEIRHHQRRRLQMYSLPKEGEAMDHVEESKNNNGNLSRRNFMKSGLLGSLAASALLFHEQKYYYQERCSL